jgi:hypothetical protein
MTCRNWGGFAGATLLAVLGPNAAGADLPVASAAYGIYARFTQDGDTVPFGPIAKIVNSKSFYNDRKTVPVHQEVPILAGKSPLPTLSIEADVALHIKGPTPWEADTMSRGLDLALFLNPPPPGATARLPRPFLAVSAKEIRSGAVYVAVLPHVHYVTGSASFDGLVVTGSLVDNKTLGFSGAAERDKILFESPNVTVTLNRQIVVGFLLCTPAPVHCGFFPDGITTNAVDIKLDRADLDGQIVSGEILLGVADAQ